MPKVNWDEVIFGDAIDHLCRKMVLRMKVENHHRVFEYLVLGSWNRGCGRRFCLVLVKKNIGQRRGLE